VVPNLTKNAFKGFPSAYKDILFDLHNSTTRPLHLVSYNSYLRLTPRQQFRKTRYSEVGTSKAKLQQIKCHLKPIGRKHSKARRREAQATPPIEAPSAGAGGQSHSSTNPYKRSLPETTSVDSITQPA
jgi:hypothetical protein